MDKDDARYRKLEQLHERREQVARLHRKGHGVVAVVELMRLSFPAAWAALDAYETGGAAALKLRRVDAAKASAAVWVLDKRRRFNARSATSIPRH